MRQATRMWRRAIGALGLANNASSQQRLGARRLAARRRFRRLLLEQFEDRRVLATANDDEYSTPMDQMLTVEGLGTWGNDSYHSTWTSEN